MIKTIGTKIQRKSFGKLQELIYDSQTKEGVTILVLCEKAVPHFAFML